MLLPIDLTGPLWGALDVVRAVAEQRIHYHFLLLSGRSGHTCSDRVAMFTPVLLGQIWPCLCWDFGKAVSPVGVLNKSTWI